MSKILIPATCPEDWKALLAEPDKQWKTGYSARALASCWQAADGFPPEVDRVLKGAAPFADIEMLLGIPEHQVPLPGGSRPSQTDLWALARCGSGLVSIAVEGKVSESFGPTLAEWDASKSAGRQRRLEALCELLGIGCPPPADIRYQLLHRTASTIIEARRFGAAHAVMLVHSFSPESAWLGDYQRFLELLGVSGGKDQLTDAGQRSGARLWLGWVSGEERWLKA